ncbi:MAG: glycosyltransferase [Bacteroidales bacterium]
MNQAILKNIHPLLSKYQIIHVTGKIDWQEISAIHHSLPDDLKQNYQIYPYLHEEMSAAFSCADLVICRSGASTLGELPFFGLPAILVPYPYAWQYQKTNAEYMVSNQAAILVTDQELESIVLTEINQLFETPEKLTEMSKAMKSLSKSNAAHQIGSLILSQVSSSNQEGGLS